ncbi:MAG: hypothetical protein AAFR67_02950 [Chloroflexota bacterium]
MLYAVWLGNAGLFASLGFLLNPIAWVFAFGYGAFPGGVMGILVGWFIKQFTENATTADELKATRWQVYLIAFFLTLGIASALVAPLLTIFALWVLIFPPFIAATASTYAAHRYLFQQRLYLEGQNTRKLKNDEKAKNQDAMLNRLSDERVIDENDSRFVGEAEDIVESIDHQ